MREKVKHSSFPGFSSGSDTTWQPPRKRLEGALEIGQRVEDPLPGGGDAPRARSATLDPRSTGPRVVRWEEALEGFLALGLDVNDLRERIVSLGEGSSRSPETAGDEALQ